MNTRPLAITICLLSCLPSLSAQLSPVPLPPAAPPILGRLTERPDPDQVAKLKSGPELPYKVDPSWPHLPAGMNFGECSGVDLDKKGNVWVFNRGSWPLIEFDRSGKMIRSFTSQTFRVLSSHGVRVGPDGSLWCVDVQGHVIFKVDPETGRILMVLGNRQGVAGNNDAQDAFNQPTNLCFRPNGNFYVSDGYVNARIVEFTPDGYYVRHWGKKGTEDGQFNLVHDVVIDSKGLVYVADRANQRVQVFDETGKFITKWTNIGAPWGLVYVAKENAIYMCDGKYDRVVKLGLDGEVLGQFGSYGTAPGKFTYVHDITFDPADGSIYTAEIKGWRVQKWVRQQP
ncbi:MAG: peptidyl-alpha-hydroxyglycine alpha-amidating lyase family protein [Opitutaceae bacterium]|jgi:DNA-binding beta-propeller fold protein YncE